MKLKNNKIVQVASVSAKPPLSQAVSRGKAGILSVLFDKKQSARQIEPEDAVIVHFQYGSKDLKRLFDLQEKIEQALSKAGVGGFDRNDVVQDRSDVYMLMYGPDADKLFEAVRPILEATEFTRGASVKLRYGLHRDFVLEVKKTIKSQRT